MFKPAPMLRLSVVVLERDQRALLRELGDLGAVQLARADPGPETAPLPPPDHAAELARCDRLLARLEDLRRALDIPALALRLAEPAAITLAEAEEELRALEKPAGDLLQRRQRLLQRWGELSALREQVSSYRELALPLDQPDRFAFLHFVAGSLPAENLDQLQKEVGDSVALLPLAKAEGRQVLIAMTTRRGRPALENALQQAGFHHEQFPAATGATTETLAEDSQREQASVAAALQQANDRIRTLATEAAPSLAKLAQLAGIERHLLGAEQNFPRTDAAVLLTGWVPAAEAPALEERLRNLTGNRCAIELAAPENLPEEDIPVLLRHSRLLRPFEMLVAAYGLPRYQELEPTLFVALSYVLMFGMMFGDAGQGSVLALGGLIAWLAGRTARARDVGLLLLFGGLSSIGFGVLYGSYFGLAQFKQYALWHDPLAGSPMDLMYSAIGVGIGMISLGLVLNIINCLRRGDLLNGLLDRFGVAGAVFYWGMLALIMKFAAFRDRGLVSLAVLLFLLLPVAGWALKGPLQYVMSRRRARAPAGAGDGLAAAFAESLVGAFEAMLSFLANTVSFVRLAAYAMSHAALLLATFMVAAEVQRFSVAGNLLSVLIIVLGNLVAIVLEGVIASVQALRLEYYEFFSKFFSGSGHAFRPFRLGATARG